MGNKKQLSGLSGLSAPLKIRLNAVKNSDGDVIGCRAVWPVSGFLLCQQHFESFHDARRTLENEKGSVEFFHADTLISLSAFLAKFEKEYNFLYEHRDNVAGYQEAVSAFDEQIAKHDQDFIGFLAAFSDFRGDLITSDREAAAFMFAFE